MTFCLFIPGYDELSLFSPQNHTRGCSAAAGAGRATGRGRLGGGGGTGPRSLRLRSGTAGGPGGHV